MIGKRIGRVRIDARVGRGGMGEVYRGFDEGLERDVAVKRLTETRRLHPEAKARLLREARLLSKLDHPGICRIHDLAETDEADCLILEYIDGRTLREMTGTLTRNELLDLFAQVADALAAAHSQEIVHRDLKPDNIMVTPELRAKVLDFGIARSMLEPVRSRQRAPDPAAIDESETLIDGTGTPLWPEGNDETAPYASRPAGPPVTSEGMLIGTVRYMSPEQARGERVTSAADMYALGVMLQEIFTGRDAYGGATGVELLSMVARAATVPAERIDDRDLAQLIDELENLDPRRRPTATETAARLRWILDRPHRERRQRTRRALGAAAAIVAILAIAAIGWRELRARRQVTIAQQFAAEARDITWMMRAEYLSPMHDLEPARTEVQRRQERLREQMNALGRLAQGPGALAFGQVHLALGELEAARTHLDAAWASGVRTPEAAFARGVVLAQLYHRGIIASRRIRDAEPRGAERDRLVRELRDPALEMLELGRESSTTPAAYIEGLVAMIEERYDDGLAATARLADAAPWMYEAPMLEGELHFFHAGDVALEERDAANEVAIWEQARDAFRQATSVGRSYPNAWARLCGVETKLAESRLISGLAPVAMENLDQAVATCEQAVLLDPKATTPHMALAGLSVLAARVHLRDGGSDPSPMFAQAREHAERAIEIDPEEPAGYLFSGWVSYWLAYDRLRSSDDPRPAARRAIERYGTASQLLPGDTEVATLLGDAYWIVASWEMVTGGDPRTVIEDGLTAIAPAVASTEDHASLGVAQANLLLLRGQVESSRGQIEAAVTTFATAAELYRRIANSSSTAHDHRVHAEAERRLAHAALSAGRDPRPYLERANAAIDRALELEPELADAELERGAALLIEAHRARQQGDDPGEPLGRAVEHLERAVPRVVDRASALLLLGTVHLDAAHWSLEENRSPLAHLAAARDAFEASRQIQPTWLPPRRSLATAALLEGTWQARHGNDPSALFARCDEQLSAVIEASTDDAESLALRADLRLQQARWRRTHGQPLGTVVSDGLHDADTALAINPRLETALDARHALEQLEEDEK